MDVVSFVQWVVVVVVVVVDRRFVCHRFAFVVALVALVVVVVVVVPFLSRDPLDQSSCRRRRRHFRQTRVHGLEIHTAFGSFSCCCCF